jgi:hypothetical protein
MATVNPLGVDGSFCHISSVGFTYGYSWPGPSRGHIHLPGPNFYVAHPVGAFKQATNAPR